MAVSGRRYLPWLSDWVSIPFGRSAVVAEIEAPGTPAPVASVTIPVISPEFSCAEAVVLQPASREIPSKVRTAKPANRPLLRWRFESMVTLPLYLK